MSFEQKVVSKFKSTKEKVENLLERFPDARNNDAYLIWLFLRYEIGINLPWLDFKKLYSIPFETIIRVRAKLQSEGQFLPTDPEVEAKRAAKRKVLTAIMSE